RCAAADATDLTHVRDVEPVVADAQPLALGELDDFDGPAAGGAVALGHCPILVSPTQRTAPGPRSTCGGSGRGRVPTRGRLLLGRHVLVGVLGGAVADAAGVVGHHSV